MNKTTKESMWAVSRYKLMETFVETVPVSPAGTYQNRIRQLLFVVNNKWVGA